MTESNLPKKYHFESIERAKSEHAPRAPNLYKDSVKKKILQALKAGGSIEVAANYGGISGTTLKRWIERGQDAGEFSTGVDQDMYLFSQACLEATSNGALYLIGHIMNHAKDDGMVALKALSTLYPEQYGPRTQTTHKVEGSVDVNHKRIDLSNASDEDLERLESMALKLERGEVVDAEILDEQE